jgi:hypothetical protein
MPSIVVHKASASDGGAAWDGVDRQMELLNRPRGPIGGQDTFAEGVAPGGDRRGAVTSVHVLVFSRTGERIFEGRGGFAFVHDLDMAGVQKNWTFKYRIRDWRPTSTRCARDCDRVRSLSARAE